MKITFLQLVNYTDWTPNLLVPQTSLRGIIFVRYLFHRDIKRICKLAGYVLPFE